MCISCRCFIHETRSLTIRDCCNVSSSRFWSYHSVNRERAHTPKSKNGNTAGSSKGEDEDDDDVNEFDGTLLFPRRCSRNVRINASAGESLSFSEATGAILEWFPVLLGRRCCLFRRRVTRVSNRLVRSSSLSSSWRSTLTFTFKLALRLPRIPMSMPMPMPIPLQKP